jgi:purine-binding chemotaxis protein CheW
MPHAPDFVRGIINLRGTVLPIVDLGYRLGFPAAHPSARHAILVVEDNGRMVGLLVDAVSDIFTAKAEEIQDVPDAASDETRRFIRGVIPSRDQLVSLIEVTSLVPSSAMAA